MLCLYIFKYFRKAKDHRDLVMMIHRLGIETEDENETVTAIETEIVVQEGIYFVFDFFLKVIHKYFYFEGNVRGVESDRNEEDDPKVENQHEIKTEKAEIKRNLLKKKKMIVNKFVLNENNKMNHILCRK